MHAQRFSSLFIVTPINEISVLLFSVIMGFFWLGTVPLTSGLVGDLFGTRYLSMLFGIVFLGHQFGGFLGAWLAGIAFDRLRVLRHDVVVEHRARTPLRRASLADRRA